MREPSAEQRLTSMVIGLRAGGLGISEMARLTHVSRQTLWRAENGEMSKPSAETYLAVEKLYRSRDMVAK
ncbi:hypothetical protein [Rhizobium sp. LjRoot254]|uniref:hypothetical protein n=1 Tax=Rhizobium sp. LjRoot254 TaxID=3342297 RepID=UPI003ECE6622